MAKTKSKFNQSYSTKVLLNMFSGDEKKMGEFHQEYTEARRYTRAYAKPTKQDFKIYNEFRKGLLYTEIMQQHGVSYSQVQSAIARVVRAQG